MADERESRARRLPRARVCPVETIVRRDGPFYRGRCRRPRPSGRRPGRGRACSRVPVRGLTDGNATSGRVVASDPRWRTPSDGQGERPVKCLSSASARTGLAVGAIVLTLVSGGCTREPNSAGRAEAHPSPKSPPRQSGMLAQDPDMLAAAGVARQVAIGRSTVRFLHATGAKATANLFPIGEADVGVRGLTHDPDVLIVLVSDFTTWQGQHIPGVSATKNPSTAGAAWLQIIGRSGSAGRPVAAPDVAATVALLSSLGRPTTIEIADQASSERRRPVDSLPFSSAA
jgi:hypothetical protein